MATPHNSAEPGDYARTVLMPGDPLRAKFIAENFLTDAKMVTSVRGMMGFTGLYQGTRVSVQGSGMGAEKKKVVIAQFEAAGVRMTEWMSTAIDEIVAQLNDRNAWNAHLAAGNKGDSSAGVKTEG